MASQVTRLESGGMIQIRTGVVQGIGPQGPTGATGPQGETGPAGPQGVPGPTGSVAEYSSDFTASSQALAATTISGSNPAAYTNITFGTVNRDDLSAQQSTVNFQLTAGADYNIVFELQFPKPAGSGTGFRAIQVVYNSVVMAMIATPANTGIFTQLICPVIIRSTNTSHVLNFKAAHNEVSALSVNGKLRISRTGPGVQGDQGDQGIQGPQGDTGPQGPTGPAGTIIDNTTTISGAGGTAP